MKIQQLSVFLQNRSGKLEALCKVLAQAEVNLSTVSLADAGEFGLLRVITSEVEVAKRAMENAGYAVTLTEVVALQVSNQPGGLHSILAILEPHQIGVEYMYAFATRTLGEAVMVFRFTQMDQAIEVLQAAGINVLKPVELF